MEKRKRLTTRTKRAKTPHMRTSKGKQPPVDTGDFQAAEPTRTERGTFAKGVSGNPAGRPVGSKCKLNEDFLRTLSEDFAIHGKQAIVTMREERPAEYVKVVASLVPKDANINVGGEAFSEFWKLVSSGEFVVSRTASRDSSDDERYGDLLN